MAIFLQDTIVTYSVLIRLVGSRQKHNSRRVGHYRVYNIDLGGTRVAHYKLVQAMPSRRPKIYYFTRNETCEITRIAET